MSDHCTYSDNDDDADDESDEDDANDENDEIFGLTVAKCRSSKLPEFGQDDENDDDEMTKIWAHVVSQRYPKFGERV